jgi:hypothetical protein
VMETLSSPPPSSAAGVQGTQVPAAGVSGVAEEEAAPLPQVSAGVPADQAGAPEASGPVPGVQEMPAGPSQPPPSTTCMNIHDNCVCGVCTPSICASVTVYVIQSATVACTFNT